jgi:hypothetical protein
MAIFCKKNQWIAFKILSSSMDTFSVYDHNDRRTLTTCSVFKFKDDCVQITFSAYFNSFNGPNYGKYLVRVKCPALTITLPWHAFMYRLLFLLAVFFFYMVIFSWYCLCSPIGLKSGQTYCSFDLYNTIGYFAFY